MRPRRARSRPSTRATVRSIARGENSKALAISPHTSRPSRSAQNRKRGSSTFSCSAHRVEAQVLDELHLGAQGVGARRGEVRLGPVALLEHRAQVVRAVVQQEAAAVLVDAAQPEVRGDLVDDRAGRRRRVGGARRAASGARATTAAARSPGRSTGAAVRRRRDARAPQARADGAELLAVMLDLDLEPERRGSAGLRGATAGPRRHRERRGSSARGSRGRMHGLQPDRLPDARRAVVPDDVGLRQPVLLAARLRDVVRIVLRPDDEGDGGRRARASGTRTRRASGPPRGSRAGAR